MYNKDSIFVYLGEVSSHFELLCIASGQMDKKIITQEQAPYRHRHRLHVIVESIAAREWRVNFGRITRIAFVLHREVGGYEPKFALAPDLGPEFLLFFCRRNVCHSLSQLVNVPVCAFT